MSISVRRAQFADLDVVLPLVQAYRAFYEQPPDAKREREFIESHLRNETSAIYLALAGEAPAGFMQIFESHSTVHLGPSLILEDLFVAPEFRKQGAARALLEQALVHAREHGAAGMMLETAYGNRAAQRLYEGAGWTREGRFYKYNAPLG